jgi:hypothetical protein
MEVFLAATNTLAYNAVVLISTEKKFYSTGSMGKLADKVFTV